MDAVCVKPVSTPRERRQFLAFPWELYRGDPHWIPPIRLDEEELVGYRPHPFYDRNRAQTFLAFRGGVVRGRVAAILNEVHNEYHRERRGFFGFFECVDDQAVAAGLFDAVRQWLAERGVDRLRGPTNPSINYTLGTLVEGFDSPPTFMMTYNPRYYLDLLAAEGFRKAKDLLAFHIDVARCPLDRLGRIAEKTRRRYPELSFTPIRRATLMCDLAKVKEVYNAAWQENWGFVPMTDAEIDFMASRLKPLLLEGLIWVAETAAEPVGFMLALPDYNMALQPLRGRLLTPKLLGFLPYLLGWKCPTRCRVITLGVKEKYRNRGLEAVMLTEGFKTGARVGFKEAEASWILEDNVAMCRLMEVFGGRVYKRYRIYEKQM